MSDKLRGFEIKSGDKQENVRQENQLNGIFLSPIFLFGLSLRAMAGFNFQRLSVCRLFPSPGDGEASDKLKSAGHRLVQ
jgi:hypothetical protein